MNNSLKCIIYTQTKNLQNREKKEKRKKKLLLSGSIVQCSPESTQAEPSPAVQSGLKLGLNSTQRQQKWIDSVAIKGTEALCWKWSLVSAALPLRGTITHTHNGSPLSRSAQSAFIGDEFIMLCEQTVRDEPLFAYLFIYFFKCSHSSTPSPELPAPGPNLSIRAHPLVLNHNKHQGLMRDWSQKGELKKKNGLVQVVWCHVFLAVWHRAALLLHTISRLASARPGKHTFPQLHERGKDFIRKKFLSYFSSSFSFSHSCISTFSYSLPILDRQEEKKNNGLSIQRAFSPFLSWPVNLFISCSAL